MQEYVRSLGAGLIPHTRCPPAVCHCGGCLCVGMLDIIRSQRRRAVALLGGPRESGTARTCRCVVVRPGDTCRCASSDCVPARAGLPVQRLVLLRQLRIETPKRGIVVRMLHVAQLVNQRFDNDVVIAKAFEVISAQPERNLLALVLVVPQQTAVGNANYSSTQRGSEFRQPMHSPFVLLHYRADAPIVGQTSQQRFRLIRAGNPRWEILKRADFSERVLVRLHTCEIAKGVSLHQNWEISHATSGVRKHNESTHKPTSLKPTLREIYCNRSVFLMARENTHSYCVSVRTHHVVWSAVTQRSQLQSSDIELQCLNVQNCD
eukprot:m.1463055 g.1463055  ORF g.1463055 m.1463055 type:complete len:320 (-) comp25134_c0_seq45:640-1599(-)